MPARLRAARRSVQDQSSDLWALLESAVKEAAAEGQLHALLVGEMHGTVSEDGSRHDGNCAASIAHYALAELGEEQAP